MTAKIVAALFVLAGIAVIDTDPASAQGRGAGGGGLHGEGGGFHGYHHGRGFHRHGHRHHNRGIIVGDFGYDYGRGYGDWYGIRSGYDECPLFRQPVKTPAGWRVQMIPVC